MLPRVAVLAVMAFGTGCSATRDQATVGAMTPDATVPRLSWHPVEAATIETASDYALVSGRLFVLDAVSRKVVVLEQHTNGVWRKSTSFGGPGGGPGEFQDPTGITALPAGGIAISERRGQLHFFTEAGAYVRSVDPRYPCRLSFAQPAATDDSLLFVAGNCLGAASDTLYAVLLWSRDQLEFEELANEPRLAVDGSWGTIYTPSRSLSSGANAVLFGVGSSGCVVTVGYDTGRPVASRRCGLATDPISASPPAGFERQLQQDRQRGRSLGSAYDWPTPLPTYFDKVQTTRGIVLLRPHHADSLFLALAREPASGEERASTAPILVASLHHLVGCNRHGCLWYSAEDRGDRLALLTTEAIETLLTPRPGEAGGESGEGT